MEEKDKMKILVVDDAQINRRILANILRDDYRILEAADGLDAVDVVEKEGMNIALILLDEVMPRMDGFGFLEVMQKRRWIEGIPVIMVSTENASPVVVQAFELGVSDFISRPFDPMIVRRRVTNTIMLYAKQKRLVGMVAEQIYRGEVNSNLLVRILSQVVEFRGAGDGAHSIHIETVTGTLLTALKKRTDRYHLTSRDIYRILTAASLHDIGMITVSDRIIGRTGILSADETEALRRHTVEGASMLKKLASGTQEADSMLIQTACEICRWHHERYDGDGYPDHLRGDETPISAQAVGLADTYDALRTGRSGSHPMSHIEAAAAIKRGECGQFNPLLVECLLDSGSKLSGVYDPDGDRLTTDDMVEVLNSEILEQAGKVSAGRVISAIRDITQDRQ